jgi:hypothetical protein
MLVQKQVVFLAYPTIKDGVLDLQVFSSRSDALRHTKGDPTKILTRTVRRDTGKPFTKAILPRKKSARARR